MFGKFGIRVGISSKGRIAWLGIVKAFYVSGGGGKGKKNMHIPFVSLHKDYYRLETLLSRVINDAQDVRQIFEWYFYTRRISSGRISREEDARFLSRGKFVSSRSSRSRFKKKFFSR